MTRRVLFVVNHLMGAGHLARVLNLGRAFRDDGYDTHVLSGGFPVPQFDTTGMTLHQMPPIKSDGANFSRLLTLEDTPVHDDYHASRVTKALETLHNVQPDILIIELFPFGRRNLKQEYLEFLGGVAALSQPPKILCSIRDILSPPSKPSKVTFAEDTLTKWYDAVLVHSDPAAVPLETTWPVSEVIRPLLRYTGFVAPALIPPNSREGAGEVLVSTGSGSFADPVFDAALDAAGSEFGQQLTWRLLLGRADEDRLKQFQGRAGANVILEAARPDFRDLLQNATAAISLCGYNSAMDLLQTGTPTVIVPYDELSETEQKMRSDALVKLPGVERVSFSDVTGPNLVDALQKVLAAPARGPSGFAFDGAARSVQICNDMLR